MCVMLFFVFLLSFSHSYFLNVSLFNFSFFIRTKMFTNNIYCLKEGVRQFLILFSNFSIQCFYRAPSMIHLNLYDKITRFSFLFSNFIFHFFLYPKRRLLCKNRIFWDQSVNAVSLTKGPPLCRYICCVWLFKDMGVGNQ